MSAAGMMNYRKNLERKARHAERLAREDAAGKLSVHAPDLKDFYISIDETPRSGTAVGGTRYIRRVVIASAPALFELPCSDPRCENGGYDVTAEFLAALAYRRTVFEGERSCPGRSSTHDCGRTLRYVATAAYRDEKKAPS